MCFYLSDSFNVKKGVYHHPRHKVARLEFAQNERKRDWSKIVFTDEKTLRNFSNSPAKVRREKGSGYDEENIISNPNKNRISINLWGFITSDGYRGLFKAPKKMKSFEYLQILYDFLFEYDMKGSVLMQDNASIHSTNLIKEMIVEENIECLKWPARSPDLNIIENCWFCLQKMVDKVAISQGGINDEDTLFRIAKECWHKIPRRIILSLYSSMSDRLLEVQKRNGSITKY